MVIVPAFTCEVCGEFLPHACAPIIIRSRKRFSGARQIAIIDRKAA